MAKIETYQKTITKCKDCKFCNNYMMPDAQCYECLESDGNEIEDINTIPKWCPLPNVQRKDDYVSRNIEVYLEIEKAFGKTVTISHHEVFRIVVSELIARRNNTHDEYMKEAFDKVIKGYYLNADEFEKHVINEEEL